MTKEQKKTVRKALRTYGGKALLCCPAGKRGTDTARAWVGASGTDTARAWVGVIREALAYYEREDRVCAQVLRLRYLERMGEADVVRRLYIGRTTYYHKDLEALSTVAILAARRGLM